MSHLAGQLRSAFGPTPLELFGQTESQLLNPSKLLAILKFWV